MLTGAVYGAEHRLRLAANVVRQGGVIAYPTEGVWGLGCDPLNEAALQRVIDIKARAPEKGLIILAASMAQLDDYIAPLSNADREKISPTWPGPNTWVVPKGAWASELLTGGRETIAVRVTAHPLVSALCALTGPLVSTSANRSGQQAALTRLQVQALQADHVLSGALQCPGQPSSIFNMDGERLR